MFSHQFSKFTFTKVAVADFEEGIVEDIVEDIAVDLELHNFDSLEPNISVTDK